MIDLNPACDRMIHLLAGVTADHLARPTPCTEYTVGDLIDHVDQVSRGFAALARDDVAGNEDTDTAAEPDAGNLGADWRDSVARHVRELGKAWDDPAAWRGHTPTGGLDLSNELWGRIALTELVVHGWDIATATGQPFDLPEPTLRACLDHVADFVPNAPVEALWGPAVEVPAGAPLLDRIVAITGRAP